MSRLFTDNNPPSYYIRCAQEKNKAISVRRITSLANSAGYISDGWCMPGERRVETYKGWYVVDGCIAVRPLRCVSALDASREDPRVEIKAEDGFTSIEAILYEGEDKLLFKDYIESAWAVICIDSTSDLDKVSVTDEDLVDRRMPRSPYMKKRKISLSDKDGKAELEWEPYETLI
jgi:hypothetical protein